jgi:trimeric autotransporter adhesin
MLAVSQQQKMALQLFLKATNLSDFTALSPNRSSGYTSGLSHIYPNAGDARKALVAYTTSTYNTGWMNGDIKLATLSDTDDTDVTGSELVTNGDMSSDTGWTLGAGWSIGSGILTASSAAAFTIASNGITTVAGKTYVATVDCLTKTSGTFRLYWHDGSYQNYVTLVAGETATLQFTASGTSGSLRLYVFTGPASGTFDNLTCRIAEEDRSVNNNGLQVFGTITKDPVATGADLVAYSGFSASNYLEQPYNADLQFGTGDFCFSYWIKFSSIVSESIYSTVGTGTSSGTEGVAANTAGSGAIGFAVYTNGIQSSGRTNCGFTYTPPTNTWICVQNVRRSGVLELWINGELDTSVANTADINATDSFTRLGGWSSGAVGASTSLSLFRASATAPSPEQIAKIYEDEKFLFQENSQATLYGSSDAVTALAYDDDTELLHVGTSAGRSVSSKDYAE